MLDELYRRINFFLKRGRLKRKNNCIIHKKANVDLRNCIFEGDNYVDEHVLMRNCNIGKRSYVSAGSRLYQTRIGRYTCVAPNVSIVNGRHPTKEYVSVSPVFYSTSNSIGVSFCDSNRFEEIRYTDKVNNTLVDIGNDVWICDGVRILDGVTIADGTIVAAGAVVVRDTEPYSIVGGVPARLIRYRFDEEQIQKLMKIKWWDQSDEWIERNAEFYDNVDVFLKNIEKLQ